MAVAEEEGAEEGVVEEGAEEVVVARDYSGIAKSCLEPIYTHL